jgi:O-antigen/teichoic acid export membrane protein
MAIDSLRKRYQFKLISGLVGLCIGIVMQSMVSRGLGPSSLGDFSYLTSVFTQIVLFFDLGNTSGFFVKVSQRPKEFGLIAFYLYFTTIGVMLFLLGLVIAKFFGYDTLFFPGQETAMILAAAVWAVIARYIQILNNITDSYGITVKSESGLILQKVTGVIIIGLMFFLGHLNLTNYFLFQYFNTFFIGFLFLWIIRRYGFFVKDNWQLEGADIRKYVEEFYKYSHPMFVGALFGYGAIIIDRWLLQYYSGSTQQGFYGLAFQISTVSTIFGGAMSMLIIREFSIAFSNNDLKQMSFLFRRYIPLLFSLTAYISCFAAVQSDKLINLMSGSEYKDAYLAVAIMCFYPVHQTYGQLSGSVFLATGQTKLYARLAIIFVIVGLPILYLLVNPNTFFGFNCGAAGLAFKMVFIQVLSVTVQLYYNSRLLSLNFWKYIGHQVISLGCFITLSVLTKIIFDYLLNDQFSLLLNFLLSGIFYTMIVLLFMYICPVLFGLTKNDINNILNFIKAKLS